jgi:hypothetical protein
LCIVSLHSSFRRIATSRSSGNTSSPVIGGPHTTGHRGAVASETGVRFTARAPPGANRWCVGSVYQPSSPPSGLNRYRCASSIFSKSGPLSGVFCACRTPDFSIST